MDTHGGKITYVSTYPPDNSLLDEKFSEIDAGDKVVMPGFVDCHTHLVWAGSRADEFYERCQGATYQEIASRGGGILLTREQTLNASDAEVLVTGRRNLRELVRNGVTTVEAKSGYALTPEGELRLLFLIKDLARDFSGSIVPTLLLHAVPPERRSSREGFLREFTSILPGVKLLGLAEFVDVYVDEHALTFEEAKLFLEEAKRLGFALKLHADQHMNCNASALGISLGATSVDHVDFIEGGVVSDASTRDTAFVLLPGANFFTGSKASPPARKLIESGAVVALATDLNPGSSHLFSPALVMTLAALNLSMSVEECISAFTKNSAFALNLGYLKGTLTPGNDADVLVLNTDDYRDLAYMPGADLVDTVLARGTVIKKAGSLTNQVFRGKHGVFQ